MRDSRIEHSIGVCKKIVASFSHSWRRRRELANVQRDLSLPNHQLVTKSPTRWGSREQMIARVLEQEPAISKVLASDKKARHLVPTWYDLQVLESVHKALRPLLDFSDAFSGEDYVTVSCIKPVLSLFNTDIPNTDLNKSIKSSILEYFNDKYSDPETSRLLNICSLTDPRFKTTYIEHNKIQEVKSQAVDEIESLLANTHSESDTVESSSTASAEAPPEPPA